MYSREDEILLTKDLLIALGLEIVPTNNSLIEQQTKTQINFDNKIVKAINDPSKMLYISESDIKLEPANPKCTKLMERLFARFVDNEVEEGNIAEMQTYYFDMAEDQKDENKYKLTIKFADGITYEGNWYYNKVLSYVEAILAIDGTFSGRDLYIFDIPRAEREQYEE